MTKRTSIVNDETTHEPIYAREGDEVAYVIPVSGVVTGITNDATLTMAFYKKGATGDDVATYWTGSMSVSGINAVITKTTKSNLKAGDWVISVKGTVDGQLQIFATVPMIIKRRGDL